MIANSLVHNEKEKRKNSKRTRNRSLMHVKPGRRFKSIEVVPETNNTIVQLKIDMRNHQLATRAESKDKGEEKKLDSFVENMKLRPIK